MGAVAERRMCAAAERRMGAFAERRMQCGLYRVSHAMWSLPGCLMRCGLYRGGGR